MERDNIKRFNHEKNMERERRKMDWKKLNIMAKEKMSKERVEYLKFED